MTGQLFHPDSAAPIAVGRDRPSLLDRVAERIYDRSAAAMYTALLGICLLNGAVATAVVVVAAAGILDLTAPQAMRCGVAAGTMTLLSLLIVFVVAFRKFATVSGWLAEKTEAAAPAAWTAGAQFTPKMAQLGVLVFTIAFVPVEILFIYEAGLSPLSVVFAFLYVEFTIGFAAVLDYFAIEHMLLPMFRDLARFLPDDFVPDFRTPSLRLRIFSVITLVSIFTAGLVTAAQPEEASVATRLAFTLIVPIVVSLSLGLAPLMFLTQSVFGPLTSLGVAVGRVETGDLNVRAPVLGADEVGHLTGSFNRMVRGLRERATLHSAMGAYIDPAVADRVLAEGSTISGEAAEVTVMFLDIVGYTAMAEHAEPEEVVSQLNEFFELAIPAIVEHGGHANKLLGDGLMAVFGVPQPLPDHADCALAGAREIQARLHERYAESLKAGIGLNSGTVVVGSMGGGPKLDYTIIGDVVNVAARIEAFTRETGDEILLTDATKTSLSSPDGITSRGMHSLKGRATQVEVWAA